MISTGYNLLFRLLFGFGDGDLNAKPKILRRDKYRQLQLRSDDWFVDAEMMIRAHETGLRIGFVPIEFEANNERRSFIEPRAVWEFVVNLFRYRFGQR